MIDKNSTLQSFTRALPITRSNKRKFLRPVQFISRNVQFLDSPGKMEKNASHRCAAAAQTTYLTGAQTSHLRGRLFR